MSKASLLIVTKAVFKLRRSVLSAVCSDSNVPKLCRAVGRSPVKQASNARGLLDGGDSEDAEAGESASLLRGQGLDSVFSHFEGQQQAQAQQQVRPGCAFLSAPFCWSAVRLMQSSKYCNPIDSNACARLGLYPDQQVSWAICMTAAFRHVQAAHEGCLNQNAWLVLAGEHALLKSPASASSKR